MKYTMISDIHANLPAIEEFFKYYDRESVLYCLGDIIGYGASPSECIRLIKERAAGGIKGNHERMAVNPVYRMMANRYAREAIDWTADIIKRKERRYISRLPETLEVNHNILLVHGSPLNPDEYLMKGDNIKESIKKIKEMGIHFCFFGHTHLPGMFDEQGGHHYIIDEPVYLEKGRYYLINPGSIGQPRDRDERGSYCVFDDELMTVTYHRFDYNVERAVDKIRQSGLPESLGNRLYHGV